MSLFLSSCFSFQTRTDLVKFYYNAAVRRFFKLLEKLQGNDCDEKLELFKIDSGKVVFLSVFQTPFCGCFQIFNRNAFLWMVILFCENTTESSKIWKLFIIKCTEILRRKTFLFFLRAKFMYILKCILLKKNR